MILRKGVTTATPTAAADLQLPNELLWQDELDWVPAVNAATYTLTGALLIEAATKQAGRPITLVGPDSNMAWVSRSTIETLRSWGSIPDLVLTLVLEYPDDSREFQVMFRHYDKGIEGKPVKGFPEHGPDDWFHVSIRLIEV
jgi:hypothetical protein